MREDARRNYARLLEVAGQVVAVEGADASLRDIARKADVGLGTLYRHFPTREALFEVLLRESLDELTQKAGELEQASAPDAALVAWFREAVAFVLRYRGVTALMAAAIADPDSALHVSCVSVRSSGSRLLLRAQAEGTARGDIDGADLLALIAALAWLSDQPSFAPRADRLFDVIAGAIMTDRSGTDAEARRRGAA